MLFIWCVAHVTDTKQTRWLIWFMVWLVRLVCSPAEEARRHQQKICWHVELRGVTVGAGYQRGPVCWPLTHGDRHEGKWAQAFIYPQAHNVFTAASPHLSVHGTERHSFKTSWRFLFRFGRLQQLCFSPPPYRSGGSRRPSADHPTRDFASHLQADEALHERGPSQETQVWHDRPHPGEDARQVNALTAICTLLLLCFFFFFFKSSNHSLSSLHSCIR